MGVSIGNRGPSGRRRHAVSDMGPSHAAVPRVGGDRVGGRKATHRMSLTKLPSGRWRAQVYDPARRRNVSVSRVLGGQARSRQRPRRSGRVSWRGPPRRRSREAVTLAAFWERWTTDPLFARPKESTNIHNRERTQGLRRSVRRAADRRDRRRGRRGVAGRRVAQRHDPGAARDVQRRRLREGWPARPPQPIRAAWDLARTRPPARAAAERGAGLEDHPLRTRAGEPVVCCVAAGRGVHRAAARRAGRACGA